VFVLQEETDAEVKILLGLKSQYKELTGEDPTPAPASSGKKGKSTKQETKPDTKKVTEKKPKDGETEQKGKVEQQAPKEVEQKDATSDLASAEGASSRELKKVTR